jgi:hypothetical protein
VRFVTGAGCYVVRVTIGAHNCYVISREHLPTAFLALVLTGSVGHGVHCATMRTLDMPSSSQASPRPSWKYRNGRDGGDGTNCLYESRSKLPSRTNHVVCLILAKLLSNWNSRPDRRGL